MSKISKQNILDLKAVVSDKKAPLRARKEAYAQIMGGMLNPKPSFNPKTFDPMDNVDDYEVKMRPRVDPPRTLPTMGMKPKEIMQGQMVGMYESKGDLYLLIAWLSERVTTLEDKLAEHGIN